MKPNWIPLYNPVQFHFCFILTISPEECLMKSFGKKDLLLHAINYFINCHQNGNQCIVYRILNLALIKISTNYEQAIILPYCLHAKLELVASLDFVKRNYKCLC